MQRRRRHRLFGYSADGRTHGLESPVDGCLGGSIRQPDRGDARRLAHRNAAGNRDAAFDCAADCDTEADGIGNAWRRGHDHVVPAIATYHTALESLVHHVAFIRDAKDVE
jgi:hypothetical protein